MKELYTISTLKLSKETIGNDEAHNWKKFKIEDVNVCGEKMDVFFCKNDKGMYAVAGQWDITGSCWGTRKHIYRIYFRKNFKTKDEGNAFYKKVRATKEI